MLYFEKIRWQNFLSTGNQWTTIQLNRSSSTLIVGENGAGKSTLLDAMSFALYGKPYRNINKPLLVNSITNKNTLVEIEFTVKKKKYLVRRGIKPAIFEIYCNDQMIDQNASIREYQEHLEKNVLKLNHKSFTQIVVIGSANFTPFMQLKPYERRQVIEDLLDIEIFSKMYTILKEKFARLKDDINETKYQNDLLEQKIDLTKKHMNEIMSLKNSDRDVKKKKVIELEANIEDISLQIDELNQLVTDLVKQSSDHDQMKTKLKKLQEYEFKLKHKMQAITSEIEFFENHDECPTCQQDLDSMFVTKRVDKQKFKKEEIEEGLQQLQNHYKEVNTRLAEISEIQTHISQVNKQIMEHNTTILMHRNNIKELSKEISEQDHIDSDDHVKELKNLKEEIEKIQKQHYDLIQKKEQYEIASSLLKDGGIKARIIRQYVPIINKLMNKYLAAMDFFVQFELDENFDEKIKSRFRDEFRYDSFSEGEKMRIDLALLFTWRAVAKLRNSASTNLLILDEVFDSSLDSTGTDEFLKIITQLNKDTNVFVISHKGDQLFDKFHSIIRFEKLKNFSQIAA